LEIRINENYNELKEIITQKDINTNEYLLSKIEELNKQIKELKK